MSISRTLWRIQLASMRNIARYDARMHFFFFLVTLFDIALGYWSGSQLMAHIEQWKSFGPLAVRSGLWSLSMLTWVGMSLIATLEFLQQSLGDDVSLLLFTLPIAPATRFRAQFGLFFINRLWNWLFLEICITGTVLFLTLGWSQALLWLILLQFGVGCAVYVTMVVLMLFIRFILPYIRAKARLALWITPGLASALALALSVQPQWGAQAVNDIASVTDTINKLIASYLGRPVPVFACPLFALLLLVALGPLARWSGNLYTAAFLVIQSWDRSRRALDIPGVRALSRHMAQQRSFTSALLVKGLLSQSRNFLCWARFVIIVAALALFQPVRTIVQAHGFSDAFFTTSYASALALLIMLEQAPNALSGEGNRLSLYLTAPFSSANILWAKLITFLLPTILVGLATDLYLSWRIGLSMSAGVYSTVALVLVLIGCIALPVFGGIWEENLNFAVEGTIQTIFQEEAAASPKRLLLVYLSLVLFAASLLILWRLPLTLAIAALLSIDIAILAGMLQWSKIYLRQLLRAG